MTARHKVYWRSGVHGDDGIWWTMNNDGGTGHVVEKLWPEPETTVYLPWLHRRGAYQWRISRTEALRLIALYRARQEQEAGTP